MNNMYVDGIKLSNEQSETIERIMNSSDNFFVTGEAGTGKSLVLKGLIENSKKKKVVLAPTGIAASNIKGQTIHNFFEFGIVVQDVSNPKLRNKISDKLKATLKQIELIIIDECSMIRVDFMDMIDQKLQIARGNNLPFGGVQMVLFGDLFQLPPVVNKESITKFLYDSYHSIFFFAAPSIQQHKFVNIVLKEVHRQNESEFINLLRDIRYGNNKEQAVEKLNKRVVSETIDADTITLTTKNSTASEINISSLAKLKSPSITYYADLSGKFDKSDYPNDNELVLKQGARIMMINNDSLGRWQNGTMGVISYLDKDTVKVIIKGREYYVNKVDWDNIEYEYDEDKRKLVQTVCGVFAQYPIKLAYAITIHKSQGLTLENVKLDLDDGGLFAEGQAYVALSRCKSLDGLYLTKRLNQSDIMVSSEVIDYMNGEFSSEVCIQSYIDDEKVKLEWHDDYVKTEVIPNPKKITGTRFYSVLGEDIFKSPFATWCEIMRLYEEPFEDNKYTLAGKAIEPIQYQYIKANAGTKFSIISPEDEYGEQAKKVTGFDFFSDEEVFGGMWDYKLSNKDNENIAIFEMKTTSLGKMGQWKGKNIPRRVIMQAALYSWLLGVNVMYIVVSFLEEDDYVNPSDYICNKNNTFIKRYYLSEEFPDFENKYVKQVIKWWEDFVKTGVSPKFDKQKDQKLIDILKERYSDETNDIDVQKEFGD